MEKNTPNVTSTTNPMSSTTQYGNSFQNYYHPCAFQAPTNPHVVRLSSPPLSTMQSASLANLSPMPTSLKIPSIFRRRARRSRVQLPTQTQSFPSSFFHSTSNTKTSSITDRHNAMSTPLATATVNKFSIESTNEFSQALKQCWHTRTTMRRRARYQYRQHHQYDPQSRRIRLRIQMHTVTALAAVVSKHISNPSLHVVPSTPLIDLASALTRIVTDNNTKVAAASQRHPLLAIENKPHLQAKHQAQHQSSKQSQQQNCTTLFSREDCSNNCCNENSNLINVPTTLDLTCTGVCPTVPTVTNTITGYDLDISKSSVHLLR